MKFNKFFWMGLGIFAILVGMNIVANRWLWFDESYSYIYASQVMTFDIRFFALFIGAIFTWMLIKPVKQVSRWILGLFTLASFVAFVSSVPAADVHPPLYYLLLKSWMWAFGGNIYVVRLLPFVFGLATMFVIWQILAEMFGKDKKKMHMTFLLFSFLFGLSSTSIHFFTENRMYATAIFLGALSFYYLIKMMNGEDRFLLNFLFVSVFMVWLHYFTVPFFMLELGLLLLFKRKSKYILYILLVLVIAVIPAFNYAQDQMFRIGGGLSPSVPGMDKEDVVKNVITDYVPYTRVLSVYYHYFFHINTTYVEVWEMLLGYVFLFTAIGLVIWYFARGNRDDVMKYSMIMFMIGVLYPFLTVVAQAIGGMYFFHVRYYVFASWMVILSLVIAIVRLYELNKSKIGGLLYKLAFILVIFAFLFSNLYYYRTLDSGEFNTFKQFISHCDGLNEDMMIVHETPFTIFPFIVLTEKGHCKNYMMVDELDPVGLRGLGGDALPFSKRLTNVDGLTDYLYLANGQEYSCGQELFRTQEGLVLYYRVDSIDCDSNIINSTRGRFD